MVKYFFNIAICCWIPAIIVTPSESPPSQVQVQTQVQLRSTGILSPGILSPEVSDMSGRMNEIYIEAHTTCWNHLYWVSKGGLGGCAFVWVLRRYNKSENRSLNSVNFCPGDIIIHIWGARVLVFLSPLQKHKTSDTINQTRSFLSV